MTQQTSEQTMTRLIAKRETLRAQAVTLEGEIKAIDVGLPARRRLMNERWTLARKIGRLHRQIDALSS